MDDLNQQISAGGHEKRCNILTYCDDRKLSIGAKRNRLMAMASGEYVAFIDDDDRVAPDYIDTVLEAITETQPDVVGLIGIISQPDGQGRRGYKRFFHTIRNSRYFENDEGYQRPPNHLNPMRRDVASRFEFMDSSFGEDTDWAMRVARSGLLRTEYMVERPLYFYDFEPYKTY